MTSVGLHFNAINFQHLNIRYKTFVYPFKLEGIYENSFNPNAVVETYVSHQYQGYRCKTNKYLDK